MKVFVITDSDRTEEQIAISNIKRQLGSFKVVITPMTASTTRTTLQNRALHLFFKIAKNALNKAGITKDVFYTQGFKECVPVDEEDVKEMARAVCQSFYKERSTTAIPPGEVQRVYEVVSRAIAARFGVDAGPFPSLEAMRKEAALKEGR